MKCRVCGHALPPFNDEGGELREIVARITQGQVRGMAIHNGRWWAHTVWGYWPVQHYLQVAVRRIGSC